MRLFFSWTLIATFVSLFVWGLVDGKSGTEAFGYAVAVMLMPVLFLLALIWFIFNVLLYQRK